MKAGMIKMSHAEVEEISLPMETTILDLGIEVRRTAMVC
jgi:hypothetical protein